MPVAALALSLMLAAWTGPQRLKSALALETGGQDAAALAALEKLAAEDQNWELPRMEAARIYLKLGEHLPKARTHLQAALKLSPENPRAHFLWGLVREEEGVQADAITSLERAVALRPDYAEAHFRLAGLYAEREDWLKAEHHYQSVARVQPESTTARLQLAVALEKQGRIEDAERALRRLWDEQPGSVVVQRKLTEFFERTGRPELAARVRAAKPGEQRKLRPLKPSKR